MKENYLAKWLTGELSGAEEEAFRKTPEFRTYQRIIQVADDLEAPHFNTEEALARVKAAKNERDGKVRTLFPRRWLGVAAAIVLLLSAGWWYWNSLVPTVATGVAQHKEVVLPDASEIALNAGSSLQYEEDDWDRERRIRLEGEAFFKVAKGKTFTVETDAGTVQVLGTQFNVLQRADIFIVSCYEGLVRVGFNGESLELPAGTEYRVVGTKAGKIALPPGGTPGWTRNESTFNSMPLSFVLQEFERQFGVEVSSTGIRKDLSFSGSFSNTNMDLALKSISSPLNMTYKVDGNKVLFYAGNTP